MLLASLGSVRLGTAKSEENKSEGADRGLGRAFGDHRSRLVLITAVAMAVLVALAAAVVVTQRGDRASANEPLPSLGIDPMKGTCPKVEPEKLPPNVPSASLSQHTAFVAKFEGEYRVWWIWH